MKVSEILALVAELTELRRAVGRWPWRIAWIESAIGKGLSRKTAMMLALVIFEGYELFPAHEHPRQSPGDRNL